MKQKATKPKKAPKPPPLPLLQPAPMLHLRWVCYALAQGFSNEHVRRLLINDDLPAPSDETLDLLRLTYPLPKGFDPLNAEHAPSVTYLRDLGLEPFFRGEAEAAEALLILRAARARELIEASFITHVPLPAVVEFLASEFDTSVSVGAIELYASVFFDLTKLSRPQLRVTVRSRVRQAVLRVVDGDDGAVRRAVNGDARVVAAGLPCTSLAWSAALLAMGLPPAKRELSRVVAEMELLAIVRTNQALARGGLGDERKAAAYIGVVQRVQEIKESIKQPGDSLARTLLSRFSLTKDERPLPTFDTLVAQGDQVGSLEVGPAERHDRPDIGGDET